MVIPIYEPGGLDGGVHTEPEDLCEQCVIDRRWLGLYAHLQVRGRL